MEGDTRGGRFRTRSLVVLVALVGVAAGAALIPLRADGAVVARLGVSPGPAIVGEAVTFTGAVPPKKRRPVQLQRRDALGWTTVAKGRTAKSGRFSFQIAGPTRVGSTSYRVFAPRVKISGSKIRAATTPTVALASVAQKAALLVPEHSSGAETYTAFSSFTPARPGRLVRLQRKTGDTWTTVRSGTEDASGRTAWQLSASGTYRAVAAASRGAAEVVAGPRWVRELPAEEVWSSSDRCRDVVWLGARGSGQGQRDSNGLGSEVQGAWEHYLETLQETDAGFWAVVYPALAADGRLALPDYRQQFAESIDTGVRGVLDFLRSRARCQDEHYVLAGFSQGAMVMHRALFAVAGGEVSEVPDLLGRIDGVLAIADGDKRAGQGGHNHGTAEPADAYGISWGATWATSGGDYDAVDESVPDSSAWPSSRFHDVCLRGDTICDWGTAFMWTGVDTGTDLHGNAYRQDGAAPNGAKGLADVRAAAAEIAATTQAWVTPPVGIGPPPVINLLDDTACSQPTVTLDNAQGVVPYALGVRVRAEYPDFSSDWLSHATTTVAPGESGSVTTASVLGGPYGSPTEATVEYYYLRTDVTPGPGTGASFSETFACAG